MRDCVPEWLINYSQRALTRSQDPEKRALVGQFLVLLAARPELPIPEATALLGASERTLRRALRDCRLSVRASRRDVRALLLAVLRQGEGEPSNKEMAFRLGFRPGTGALEHFISRTNARVAWEEGA